MSFQRLLIANRGEIAVRVARTARRMGLSTVAVYSDADASAPHVAACDHAVHLGGSAPAESYLAIDRVIDAARRSGAEAVHPGYGFLSENARFAQAVLDAGLVFVGPDPAAIAAMGDKALARRRMAATGIPVLPGYDDEGQSDAVLVDAAQRIGYPVMIKAAAGGGGRGMRLVHTPEALPAALMSARSEAAGAFGDARLILERALLAPRHIEVQVLADARGHTLHLGERDCSIQRRHQKIVEESPAPGFDATLRERIGATAVAVAQAVGYRGAGTVEFLFEDGGFHFMEMNTRLQVEHPVTEAVTGLDLVEWQLRIARGEPLPWSQDGITLSGHAIEVRLCAEDPALDFLPQIGRVELWRPPPGARVDHALADGLELTPHYDSMLGKIIVHAASREQARSALSRALDETVLLGVACNRGFLGQVVDHPAFVVGEVSTAFLGRHFAVPDQRESAPDESAWAGAAVLSVAPPAGLPAEWRGFATSGVVRLPVRLAWRDRTRDGVVLLEAGMPVMVCWSDGVQHVPTDGGLVSRRRDDDIFVQDRAGTWAFSDLRLRSRSEEEGGAADGRVSAPLNGRVVQVAAGVGEAVRRGAALVTLEAMKMEHVLAAPVDGTVSAVHVATGDQVGPGRLLVEITPG
jgi:geranyl-CoA carboxylase alpha subunit